MKIKGFDVKDDIAEFEKQINEFLTGVTMKDIALEKHTTTYEVRRYETVTETWYKAVIKYEENVQRIEKIKIFNKKPFLEMITEAQAFMDTVNVIDVKFFISSRDDENKFILVIYDENRGNLSEGAEMGIEFFKGSNIESINNEIDVFCKKFEVVDAQIAGYENDVNIMLNYVQNENSEVKTKVFFGKNIDVVKQINEFMPDIVLKSIDYVDCGNAKFALVLTYTERTDGLKSLEKIRLFSGIDKEKIWNIGETAKEETIKEMNDFISGAKIFNVRMKNIQTWYSVLFVYED